MTTEILFDNIQIFMGNPNPTWASSRLGIYLCLNCAGRHRGYGVAISFVRAVDMDRWSEDLVSLTLAGGNRRFDEFLRHKKVLKPVAY